MIELERLSLLQRRCLRTLSREEGRQGGSLVGADLSDDGLVLDRVEGARGVHQAPAHRQQRRGVQRDAQLRARQPYYTYSALQPNDPR